jgi:hypothetical protein
MSDSEIGPTFNLPYDAIRLTPPGPELPEFSYRQQDGAEVITLSFTDERVGAIEVAFDPSLAGYVGAHLTAMSGEKLAALRQRWIDRGATNG